MSKTILSPLPGIFHRRPSPDQPYFKTDGDGVSEGDTVGLIEIMKTFYPVAASTSGRIIRFVTADGAEVTAGQILVELKA